nr:uncharacterized protein LOC131771253 [Pocillopora verrucosa]
MIRCVKRCLQKILKNVKLTYDELLTVVVEVECVLNSRPLTCVSSEDTEEPLTSSHPLTVRGILYIPDECATADEDETDVQLLTRRQRCLSKLLGQLIRSSDIVTEMEEGKSNRSTWKLGRIAELHPGNDGFVRGTTVEVASSSGKRKRLRRPLQKLFPLEVREVGGTGQVPARPEENTQRQRRRASITGEVRRREVHQSLQEQEN